MKVRQIIALGVSILIVTLVATSSTLAGTERLVEPSKYVEPPISLEKLRELLPGIEVRMEIKPLEGLAAEVYGSNTLKCYIFGRPPEFKMFLSMSPPSEREEKEWFNKLIELANRIDPPVLPFWDPGPVVFSGVGADGYFHVGFKYDMLFTEAMMVEIVKVIHKEAKEIEFRGEVPIYFGRTGPSESDSRTENYRPIIGGVQVQNVDQGVGKTSTLGWSAQRSGVKGYVVAGHIGNNRPVPVGTAIYQSTYNNPAHIAGSVGAVPTSPYYADVAWVPFSNVSPKFYLAPNTFVSVNWYEEPFVNADVHKSGLGTDVTKGKVKYVGVDAPSPEFGTLRGQALATYTRGKYDSGAPVYIATSYGRGMVGIHSGANLHNGEYLARFSPPSGVNIEVGAVPLTTWP